MNSDGMDDRPGFPHGCCHNELGRDAHPLAQTSIGRAALASIKEPSGCQGCDLYAAGLTL